MCAVAVATSATPCPGMQEQGVSMTCLGGTGKRLGKLCNIPLGGKCETGAQSSFVVFLSMNNL